MTTDLVDRLRGFPKAKEVIDIISLYRDGRFYRQLQRRETVGLLVNTIESLLQHIESLTKPLSDAKVREITARHERDEIFIAANKGIVTATQDHADRAYLLSDRETLIRERDEARAALESALSFYDTEGQGDNGHDAPDWVKTARSMKGE